MNAAQFRVAVREAAEEALAERKTPALTQGLTLEWRFVCKLKSHFRYGEGAPEPELVELLRQVLGLPAEHEGDAS